MIWGPVNCSVISEHSDSTKPRISESRDSDFWEKLPGVRAWETPRLEERCYQWTEARTAPASLCNFILYFKTIRWGGKASE